MYLEKLICIELEEKELKSLNGGSGPILGIAPNEDGTGCIPPLFKIKLPGGSTIIIS